MDYNDNAVDDILDIHKCLMKKNDIVYKMVGFVKQIFVSAMMFLVIIYQM